MPRPNGLEIGAAVLVIVVVLALAWNFDPFGRRKRAEARADTAEVQVEYDRSASSITARTTTNTRKASQASYEGRHAIQQAPDVDSVLSNWSHAIDVVCAEGRAPVTDAERERSDRSPKPGQACLRETPNS